MSEAIEIGGVAVLYQRFSDWQVPAFATPVRVLSDGTTVDNEVLQSGAVPRQRATVNGWVQDFGDVETLKGYTASKELVLVNDDGTMHSAVVLDLVLDRVLPGLWSCTVTLLDFGAGS